MPQELDHPLRIEDIGGCHCCHRVVTEFVFGESSAPDHLSVQQDLMEGGLLQSNFHLDQNELGHHHHTSGPR